MINFSEIIRSLKVVLKTQTSWIITKKKTLTKVAIFSPSGQTHEVGSTVLIDEDGVLAFVTRWTSHDRRAFG